MKRSKAINLTLLPIVYPFLVACTQEHPRLPSDPLGDNRSFVSGIDTDFQKTAAFVTGEDEEKKRTGGSSSTYLFVHHHPSFAFSATRVAGSSTPRVTFGRPPSVVRAPSAIGGRPAFVTVARGGFSATGAGHVSAGG
jgi:hypothetical protein